LSDLYGSTNLLLRPGQAAGLERLVWHVQEFKETWKLSQNQSIPNALSNIEASALFRSLRTPVRKELLAESQDPNVEDGDECMRNLVSDVRGLDKIMHAYHDFQSPFDSAVSSDSVPSEASTRDASPPQGSQKKVTCRASPKSRRKTARTSTARKDKLSKAKRSKGLKGKNVKKFFCSEPGCSKGSKGTFLVVQYFSTHKLQDTLERIIWTVIREKSTRILPASVLRV
jgi:hypothetical protein